LSRSLDNLKATFQKILPLTALLLMMSGCVSYGFTGGSLPDHIKTVQIILFEDNTNRYDLKLAETISSGISAEIEKQKLLEIDNSIDSDAKIFGTVTRYEEVVVSQSKDEIADERQITIAFKLTFYDRSKNKTIVAGEVSKSEPFAASGGEVGRKAAFDKIIKTICEDAVIKLTSNW